MFKVLKFFPLNPMLTKTRGSSMPVPQLRLTLARRAYSHTLDLLWQCVDDIEARVKEVSCTAVTFCDQDCKAFGNRGITTPGVADDVRRYA
jgi:hypothetical protein